MAKEIEITNNGVVWGGWSSHKRRGMDNEGVTSEVQELQDFLEGDNDYVDELGPVYFDFARQVIASARRTEGEKPSDAAIGKALRNYTQVAANNAFYAREQHEQEDLTDEAKTQIERVYDALYTGRRPFAHLDDGTVDVNEGEV